MSDFDFDDDFDFGDDDFDNEDVDDVWSQDAPDDDVLRGKPSPSRPTMPNNRQPLNMGGNNQQSFNNRQPLNMGGNRPMDFQNYNSFEEEDNMLSQNQPAPQSDTDGKKEPAFMKVGVTFGVIAFIVAFAILAGRFFIKNQSQPVQTPPQTVTKTTTKDTETPASPLQKGADITNQGIPETVTKGSMIKPNPQPAFTKLYNATGMVTEKGIVEIAGTDTYVAYMDIMLTVDGKSVPITYFCNKDSTDAVNLGQTVVVYYQLDSSNKLIVVKVTD